MLTSVASSLLRKAKGHHHIRRHFSAFPAPKLFDYDTIVSNLKMDDAIVASIEEAFGALARNEVDVPLPMHIGIPEDAEKVRLNAWRGFFLRRKWKDENGLARHTVDAKTKQKYFYVCRDAGCGKFRRTSFL